MIPLAVAFSLCEEIAALQSVPIGSKLEQEPCFQFGDGGRVFSFFNEYTQVLAYPAPVPLGRPVATGIAAAAACPIPDFAAMGEST